ncbi:MAG: hypothetical protein Q4C41_03710 [Eggerthellaceae bacterium]|nr:hypothetical protein [Eggerthellaceae bacterium]
MELIFIPFQDEYCFENDGILTREYAMLNLLLSAGCELGMVVNKPRTVLDAKVIKRDMRNFPDGSVEAEVLAALDGVVPVNPKRLFSLRQVTSKRAWWVDAYLDALDDMPRDLGDHVVYTNTPFSWKLVKVLKARGVRVVFDSMDNMMTYPHFWDCERAAAKEGYDELLSLADYSCANSQRTVDCFEEVFGKKVDLVKNGVFAPRKVDACEVEQVKEIAEAKKGYSKCAGFVGKFGLRIDHDFIGKLAKANPGSLFVFVGPELDGQCDAFNKVVASNANVLKLPALPSAYLYAVLDLFDMLMIPYSVGENENSGDPLKLYQYFMTDKPIACTPIREVGEYSDLILVSNDVDDWTRLLRCGSSGARDYSSVSGSIMWDERALALLSFIADK